MSPLGENLISGFVRFVDGETIVGHNCLAVEPLLQCGCLVDRMLYKS